MQLKNFNVYFFFIILISVSVLTFLIFKPFLVAILIAAVLSVIFYSPYDYIFNKLGKERKRLSALITSAYAFMIFIIPLFIVIGLVVSEAASVYGRVSSGEAPLVESIMTFIDNNNFLSAIGASEFINTKTIANSFSQISQSALSILQKTYSGVAQFFFQSFVMFFTLYFFLVHGKTVVKKIMNLSPLRNKHENLLIEKFISISRATIKGTLVVAFIQGFLGGVAFAIAGIPSAVIWSVIMMLLSLIPMFGSSLIWFPAAITLLLMGSIWQGIFLLIVGFLIISLIDNFLRPELVGKDTQMHPLIVFFSTLGGISLFGFLGFLIGPIIVALFLSLWDIYAVEFKGQLSKFNR